MKIDWGKIRTWALAHRTILQIVALVLLAFALGRCAHAQGVPITCGKYRAALTHAVYTRVSVAAPVSTFAAQMMQESACNPLARSPVGAQGLLQFMPATAEWVRALDAGLAPARPFDAEWALAAQSTYMAWLMRRDPGKTECDTYAFGFSSYNGGEGWLRRDQRVTRDAGFDPLVWFGSVETHPDTRRSVAARGENRGYPRRILYGLQPRFVAAGWGRGVDCSEGLK